MDLPPQIGYCVDVSHWQPLLSPLAGATHAYVRAQYGQRLDDRAIAHVRNFKAQGLFVGLYAFFRATESVDVQLASLERAHDLCGLGTGDLVPALDVEDDGSSKVSATWSEPTHDFVEGLVARFGGALLYETQRDFHREASPSWITDNPIGLPLWVAHYTAAPAPATPGDLVPALWQHRVGPWDPHGPGGYFKAGAPQLDQSRVYREIPTIR